MAIKVNNLLNNVTGMYHVTDLEYVHEVLEGEVGASLHLPDIPVGVRQALPETQAEHNSILSTLNRMRKAMGVVSYPCNTRYVCTCPRETTGVHT